MAGDYAGTVKGEDPLLTAVKSYQKRIKNKVTGLLTNAERASLLAAARDHEEEFGWSVVVDPATGIRIGLPTKMVPNAHEAARGTRWSSAHGDIQVETFRIADPEIKLAALFEDMKKELSRQVEYSVLRDDNFFISGLQGLKRFSVKAQLRDGEVRGFTMLYDQMMETIVAPVAVAMASAFLAVSRAQRAVRGAGEIGRIRATAWCVSAQGHIVTDRKLTEGCQVIVAAGLGDAVRIADDKDSGLALLRV